MRSHLSLYPTGGLLWYGGDSDDASLNPALNAAMLLMRYADSNLASTSDKAVSYVTFAQKQLNYALGNNPMTSTATISVCTIS